MQQILKDIASDAAMQHITPQMIAEKTGLDRKTVASILSGENEHPNLQTVQTIAECLGGSIGYITEDSKHAVKAADISYYRTLLASMKDEIKTRDKFIKWLFFTAIGLTALDALTTLLAYAIASA